MRQHEETNGKNFYTKVDEDPLFTSLVRSTIGNILLSLSVSSWRLKLTSGMFSLFWAMPVKSRCEMGLEKICTKNKPCRI